MFALCAIGPIVVLGGISYFQVSQQLRKQNFVRMQNEVKAHGLGIYERLVFLESELSLIGLKKTNPLMIEKPEFRHTENKIIPSRFKSIAIIDIQDKMVSTSGSIHRRPSIQEKKHMQDGKSVIWIDTKTEAVPRIFMMQALPASQHQFEYLVAEIVSGYLWGEDSGNMVSPLTDVFILGPSKTLLFSSIHNPDPFLRNIKIKMSNDSSGAFDVRDNENNFSLVYRLIFTQPRFLFEGYTVVLRQPTSFTLQPMATFRQTFPAIVVASLLTVLLLSIIHIRKSLIPLDLLEEGIIRIAEKNFHHRVELNSGDEFEELSIHFNQMAEQISLQFKSLNTRAEIDRSILSSMEKEEIIGTAIKGMQGIFKSDSIAVSLIKQRENHISVSYISEMDNPKVYQTVVSYTPRDIDSLKKIGSYRIYHHTDDLPQFLSHFTSSGAQTILVLPIILEGEVAAVIILSRQSTTPYREKNIIQAKQMADHVAVALSKSQLMEELHSINWGTLIAFGRAVDAKSPWTAGHSERVAKLAVNIGRRMNLDERKLEMLERAGFLHDIGKIGVPASILDKPDKLSPDEMGIIRKHPVIGARILEPIEIFTPIIPMILQHHEQFGGNGYPNGISGKNIDMCARILSIADVFDALTSDRPYRNAMALEKAIQFMVQEAGNMFDPEILDAFLDFYKSGADLFNGEYELVKKQDGYNMRCFQCKKVTLLESIRL